MTGVTTAASAPPRIRVRAPGTRRQRGTILGLGLALAAAAFWAPPAYVLGAVVIVIVIGIVVVSRRDPAAVLSALIAFLMVIPERYVIVGPLRSAGYPPQMLGIAALGLWWAGRMLRHRGLASGPQPVRWVVAISTFASLASFAAALTRPLTTIEGSGAVRALLTIVAVAGIALLAADGLTSRDRIDALLRRVVILGAFEAMTGIVEYLTTNFDAAILKPPGFTSNIDILSQVRSGFARVQGTANHPIEFAVVLGCLVPLALHYAWYRRYPRDRVIFGFCALLMMAAIPMPVARSGVVALVVAVGVYSVQWSPRGKVNAAVLGVIGLVAFRAAVPGLLGTLKALFLDASEDPSIKHRTADYTQLPGLLHGHWIFGRGLGTFQPAQYFFLDNQYIGSMLEGGVLAVAAMVSVFVVGASLARSARKHSIDPETRSLNQAVAAGICALAVSAATFDEFGFKQTYFMLFLLLGCAGALWRLSRNPLMPGETTVQGEPGEPKAHVVASSPQQEMTLAGTGAHRQL